jgi:hypothetical protein
VQNDDIYRSLTKVREWVESTGWKAYDTFDGLSSPYAPFLTAGNPFLKQVWQQSVRRFPINLRPLLSIKPNMSTKGMAFFAQGYLRLYEVHGDQEYLKNMRFCLQWLMENRSQGFNGHCWGNHFDYQSRGGNIPKGCPTIVWTGLIGHAFLDAYESLGDKQYLDTAVSACEFIVNELGWMEMDHGICLRYYPNADEDVHNSSMIGASLLARVNSITPRKGYLDIAERAVAFTVAHQTPEGGWYYGVDPKWKWIDSFHTAYVLESLDTFNRCAKSEKYAAALEKGYLYFFHTFFTAEGVPRYYDTKTLPIDIQCASQGVQTLVALRRFHPESVPMACKVARWTIKNMQDPAGFFYYRKYPLVTNKTPTLHWGQATMFAALTLLHQHLQTKVGARAEALKEMV